MDNPRLARLEDRFERKLGIALKSQGTRYPLVRKPNLNPPYLMSGDTKIKSYGDAARGVAELANAIQEKRACRISADFALHITEITTVLQHPECVTLPYHCKSSFKPFPPMPWAK